MNLPFSQSCENNKAPILAVLKRALAPATRVLEIGSGTGQHAVYFSRQLPHLHWQPSDQGEYLAGLRARLARYPAANLGAPLELDVAGDWPDRCYDGVFTANTCHIMAWEQVVQMWQGVGRVLEPGGRFCVYGPFNRQGRYTSDSNAAFDRWLIQRDPLSGIRDLEAMEAQAQRQQMTLATLHTMPANNLLLEFHRAL
ncbi:DUF938 domain-containing protein [Ferrimonas sediminicola]|uniref:DUF938 domain-containing protein n=1 Tax=Ferrimonas sediminicola TaxID=2569538 RepID=A0A4U1BBJ8_9GAMM|nr:DUF938 domain-containing protein [Ferrimonas sediminicola]TKB48327.1 DUF938 domain-containing protein [Ferrimonas sediminicola]